MNSTPIPRRYPSEFPPFETRERWGTLSWSDPSQLKKRKVGHPPDDEVVAAHFSPGPADGQAVFGGARHENGLRPLPALLLVLDNFRFALRHRPPSEQKRQNPEKLANAAVMV